MVGKTVIHAKPAGVSQEMASKIYYQNLRILVELAQANNFLTVSLVKINFSIFSIKSITQECRKQRKKRRKIPIDSMLQQIQVTPGN